MEVFIRKNAVFAGVCGGLAEKLNSSPALIRALMIFSLFVSVGTTFIFYLAAVFSFPTVQEVESSSETKFLGVCSRLAPKLNIHATWLRFFVFIGFIFTGFFPAFVTYIVVYIILNSAQDLGPSEENIKDVN